MTYSTCCVFCCCLIKRVSLERTAHTHWTCIQTLAFTCTHTHTHTHAHTHTHTLQQPLGSQWQDITWLVYDYRCWQQKISMMDSVCGWQRSLMTSSPSTCCSHPSSSPMNLPWVSRLDSNVPMVVSHRYGGPFIIDNINCRNKIKIGGWGSEWGCCIVCQCIHHTFCPLGVCVWWNVHICRILYAPTLLWDGMHK